ncbi:MAG: DUF1028 domain-containing protein [Bacteroidetes bacterium]|nr:MAG: DUF1028 domain-containing protein [Bacteroidota bacterium]
MKQTVLLFAILISVLDYLNGQDTFSIVAVDPATGEVGSAGASCISKDNLDLYYPNFDPDFLGDLLPGLGAINTQSYYLSANQQQARSRLLAGDTPQQLMDWLAANDAQGNSTQRQYGAAAIINGTAQAAAFTGINCQNYKSHRVGPNYAIQGNILLGAGVLDSMEARFLQSSGCLSDRLMAAMQGARIPGADSRCLSNGTSSMFAFIKVARPGDDLADPYLRLFVSLNPVGLEPIDSLQVLYDAAAPCTTPSTEVDAALPFQITPNPASGAVTLWWSAPETELWLEIFDVAGKPLGARKKVVAGQLIPLGDPGSYILKLSDAHGRSSIQRVIAQ